MPSAIIVPLDGSLLAKRAIPIATRIASLANARLILVHAADGAEGDVVATRPSDGDERASSVRQPVGVAIEALARQLRESGLAVESRTRVGDAAEVILETARAEAADLVVMATHGRGGLSRLLHGSVADQVLRRAVSSILLVPASAKDTWPQHRPLRIAVPLDGSARAETALGPARELASLLGAELLLLRVVEPPPLRVRNYSIRIVNDLLEVELAEARRYLAGVAEGLREEGARLTTRVLVGDLAWTIAGFADRSDVDLVAMATRGLGGLSRLVQGSVASETLVTAAVPLLLVRGVSRGRSAEKQESEAGSVA